MLISWMSINVSPHRLSTVVAVFNTATAKLTFWRSVSKSACAFLHFSVSMSRRVARSFFAFCSHSGFGISFSFELHTSRYSCFTPSDCFWASLSRMPQHTIFICLLFLASWMIFSKPYNILHQLIEWLVINKLERMQRKWCWGNLRYNPGISLQRLR